MHHVAAAHAAGGNDQLVLIGIGLHDQHILNLLAGQHGGQFEAGIKHARHILETVHGAINLACSQGFFNSGDEYALVASVGGAVHHVQGDIRPLVARGGNNGDAAFKPRIGSLQGGYGLVGLCQC